MDTIEKAQEDWEQEDLDCVKVALTCTAHGKPYWRWVYDGQVDLLDQGIFNTPPVRILTLTEADDECIDLENPLTWWIGSRAFWIDEYLGGSLQLEKTTPAQIGALETLNDDLYQEFLGEVEGYLSIKSLGPFDDLMEAGNVRDFFHHLEGEELATEPLSRLTLEADRWACECIYNRPECDLREEMDAIDSAEDDSELKSAIETFYARWPESFQRYNESLLYQ